MTDGPALWYLNRSTGLVLLVLLTTSVVLGVLALGGRPGRGLPRFATQSLHRNVALLSVLALAVHVTTAVMDSFVDIRWWNALLPAGAAYEPLWLGLGTLSLDLVVVVVVTSLLRTRLRHRTWRIVHLSAYLAWVAALAHTIGIGTDLKQATSWAVIPTAACVLAVAAATAYRLIRLASDRQPIGSPS
jgi:methionine sulfoxide reductase heme-binding subunit